MTNAIAVENIQRMAARIRENVQRVIVGKDEAINLAIIALLCRGHILVEDAPGIGKTTLAKALAQSLHCTFKRIQFTPDLMPTDVLGVNFYNQRTGDFQFRGGPIFSQLLLADEINRATPRTQSSLLEAMQERQATIDGETRRLPEPFLVMATQNPIEMEGTFPLPEAQLDRFMLRIQLGYPTPEEESDILLRFEHDFEPPEIDAVLDVAELSEMQALVNQVLVDDTVRLYIVDIIQSSRKNQSLTLGAEPSRRAGALQGIAGARRPRRARFRHSGRRKGTRLARALSPTDCRFQRAAEGTHGWTGLARNHRRRFRAYRKVAPC